MFKYTAALAGLCLLALAGCGGGGSSSSPASGTAPPPATHTAPPPTTTPAPPPATTTGPVSGFSLAVSPSSQSIVAGASTTLVVTLNNSPGTAILSLSGSSLLSTTDNAGNIGYTFQPAALVSGSTALTLDIGSNVPATTYNLTATATDGATVRTATLALTVTSPSANANGAVVTNQVVSESTSDQADAPVTFGQIFKDGDVPKGASLTATVAGVAVPLQVDAKATNPDGSLRHAVLTTRIPALAANAAEPLTISTGAATVPGVAVSLGALLATQYDATASLNIGGTPYTLDARTLLEAANTAGACKPWNTQCNLWLSGPLVSEWVVGGPVTDASGTANPNIQVYFDVRAYAGSSSNTIGYVSTDIVVENSWVYTPIASVQYIATLTSGSASYTSAALTQYNATRWHEDLWWNNAQPSVYLQQNTQYIQATRAVPRYEILTPDQAFLASLPQACPPLKICDQEQAMADEGAQDGIGPLPRWTAVYLVDPDVRAYNWMLANTDALGPYSIHFRDNATGFPISIVNHPYATETSWAYAYEASRNNPTQLGKDYLKDLMPTPCSIQPGYNKCGGYSTGNPDLWDQAHQPAEGYVAYMVTGSYYYEQEVAFGASHNEVWSDAVARGLSQGLIWPAHAQTRGIAWTLREMADAAYILPDNAPLKTEFYNDVENNINDLNTRFTNNPNANPFHIADHTPQPDAGYQIGGTAWNGVAPWMDDFMTWSADHTAELEFPGAPALYTWLSQFQIGLATDPGYCWLVASAYGLAVLDNSGNWLPNLAAAYAATYPTLAPNVCNSPDWVAASIALGIKTTQTYNFPQQAGQMWGYPQSATGYPANFQIGVAAAADSGLPNAQKAWQVFQNRATYPTQSAGYFGSTQGYRNMPNFAILPRSLPKGPIANIYALHNPVASGTKANLYWNASDATSCSAPWTTSTATFGQFTTPALASTTSYPITCSGPDGSVQTSVTVTVGNGG